MAVPAESCFPDKVALGDLNLHTSLAEHVEIDMTVGTDFDIQVDTVALDDSDEAPVVVVAHLYTDDWPGTIDLHGNLAFVGADTGVVVVVEGVGHRKVVLQVVP